MDSQPCLRLLIPFLSPHLTACVTRGWAGRDHAALMEPTSSHANCLKTRRLPPVGCTLCWAASDWKHHTAKHYAYASNSLQDLLATYNFKDIGYLFTWKKQSLNSYFITILVPNIPNSKQFVCRGSQASFLLVKLAS